MWLRFVALLQILLSSHLSFGGLEDFLISPENRAVTTDSWERWVDHSLEQGLDFFPTAFSEVATGSAYCGMLISIETLNHIRSVGFLANLTKLGRVPLASDVRIAAKYALEDDESYREATNVFNNRPNRGPYLLSVLFKIHSSGMSGQNVGNSKCDQLLNRKFLAPGDIPAERILSIAVFE